MSRFCCAIPGPKGDTGEIFARYGSFYSLQDQHYAQNTPTAMEFEITDLSNGVSITNNALGRPTRISFDNLGVYNIQFSAQIAKTGANDTIDIWLMKNNQNVVWSDTSVYIQTSSQKFVAAWNFMLPLNAGDYFEIAWSSALSTMELLAQTASAPAPAIPSVIITVQSV